MAKRLNKLLNEALAGLYPALESMTDAELFRVSKCQDKLTQSNCWWVAYQAAPLLADIATQVLKSSRFNRRKEKRSAPPKD